MVNKESTLTQIDLSQHFLEILAPGYMLWAGLPDVNRESRDASLTFITQVKVRTILHHIASANETFKLLAFNCELRRMYHGATLKPKKYYEMKKPLQIGLKTNHLKF